MSRKFGPGEDLSLKFGRPECRPLRPDDIENIRNGEAEIVLSMKPDINFDLEEVDIGEADRKPNALRELFDEIHIEPESA